MRHVVSTYRWMPALALTMAALATTTAARAELVDWDFVIEATSENDVFWTSQTTLPTGLSEYTYTYEVTEAEVQAAGAIWLPVPDAITSGGGTFGSLPVVLINEIVDDTETGNAVSIEVGIDAAGEGYASLTDIQFGTFNGLDITGVRFVGNVKVVPEPATVALLAFGGIAAAMRRPRRATA